jgi:hypothetical protein
VPSPPSDRARGEARHLARPDDLPRLQARRHLRHEATIAALGTRAAFFVNREYAFLPACPAPKPDIIIPDERMTIEAVTITSIEPAKMTGDPGAVPWPRPGRRARRRPLDRARRAFQIAPGRRRLPCDRGGGAARSKLAVILARNSCGSVGRPRSW